MLTEMKNNGLATTIITVLVSLEIGVAEIVTKPSVTEVVVGGSTFLNCSTNSKQEIHWFHAPYGSNAVRKVVYGYNKIDSTYVGRFNVEKSEDFGAYNLVIQSVKIEDAGVYECQDETGAGQTQSTQLIVLDTNPVCEPHSETHEIIGSNNCGIDPNQLILSCTVRYHGNDAPILEWRNSTDNKSISDGVTHATKDNNVVVYNLTIKENSSVKDGDSYNCYTTRATTLNTGCKSGKIKVKGGACPACVASDCTPYVNPYIAAVIFLVILLITCTIVGTVFVLWYLRIYRRLQHPNIDLPLERDTCTGTTEETENLFRFTSTIEESNDGKDLTINTLRDQLKEMRERIERRDTTIVGCRQKEQLNGAEINSLKLENDQLKDKVKVLERRRYTEGNVDYLDDPVLAHTIEFSEKNNEKSEKKIENAISGITVLGTELFVVTYRSKQIEVYDSKTFQYQRTMETEEITDPMDITSSKDANCLYIVGRFNKESESRVLRLDRAGKVLRHWLTGGGKGRLSTYGSNVILCLSDKQLIDEYSSDGELMVRVRLSPAAKLNNPLHAIKVTSEFFVVSHGDYTDELHRVCLIDLDGNIKKECKT